MKFDWNELAFSSKKPVNDLQAIFIVAPRAISSARFIQIVKQYLPKANILLGISKEEYVLGFENQPQFRTLALNDVQQTIDKVNASRTSHKIATLSYLQRDLPHILQKIAMQRVVLINGSWQYSFHVRPEYYALANRHIPYDMISPFANENEAIAYGQKVLPPEPTYPKTYAPKEMLRIAQDTAKRSFDHTYQTGVSLGRKTGARYTCLATSYNKVVPYQGYAMHYGASREIHFSPPNDLNHYDTVHAEVMMILKAQQQAIDLHGTTLFINLLPCPSCARMFTETDIAEFVYSEDHSKGYAINILQKAGKKVTRIIGE